MQPDYLCFQGPPVAHLKINECIFTRHALTISTVLGSCVSVTMRHATTGFAGMCHCMLPESGRAAGDGGPCRFVDTAVVSLLERFKAKGVSAAYLEVKIFGGALSLQRERKQARALLDIVDVGKRNVITARRELGRRGCVIRAEHVLGDRGRKVLFDTWSGEVRVRTLTAIEKDPPPFQG